MVAEINVVPYIDVMLVLLVIFMVTAPLLPPGAIDLPSAGQSNAKTEGFIELVIQRNGSMSVRTPTPETLSKSRIGLVRANCSRRSNVFKPIRIYRSSSVPTNRLPMKRWLRPWIC